MDKTFPETMSDILQTPGTVAPSVGGAPAPTSRLFQAAGALGGCWRLRLAQPLARDTKVQSSPRRGSRDSGAAPSPSDQLPRPYVLPGALRSLPQPSSGQVQAGRGEEQFPSLTRACAVCSHKRLPAQIKQQQVARVRLVSRSFQTELARASYTCKRAPVDSIV